MSDEDRMDRARRIRKMRESGDRASETDGEDGDQASEDGDQASSDGDQTDDSQPAGEMGADDEEKTSSPDAETEANDPPSEAHEGSEAAESPSHNDVETAETDEEEAFELGMDDAVADRFQEATMGLADAVGAGEEEVTGADDAVPETESQDTVASNDADPTAAEGDETDGPADTEVEQTVADETDLDETIADESDEDDSDVEEPDAEEREADGTETAEVKADHPDGETEGDETETGGSIDTVAETGETVEADLDQLNIDDSGISAPLPGIDQLEEALEESGVEPEAARPSVEDTGEESVESTEETRVLEFVLGEEFYCLDIEYIEEILKKETITRVPNTPDFVEGVVDLRGQITTILNPKVTLEKDDQDAGRLLVVFDEAAFEEKGHLGWTVDDVRQVTLVSDHEVNEPPMDERHVNGIIDREDEEQFVVWTTPELAFETGENA